MRKVKKILFILLIGIFIINTPVFAKELKDGDPLLQIITDLAIWRDQNDLSELEAADREKIAEKLAELANNDLDTLMKLSGNFEYDGLAIWRAGAGAADSETNLMLDIAIHRVTNGTVGQVGTEDEKIELEKQIKDLLEANNNSYSKMTTQELNKLDSLLKEHYTKYTGDWNKYNEYTLHAEQVDIYLKGRNYTGKTAYEEFAGIQEVIHEEDYRETNEGDTSSTPSTGILGNPEGGAQHTVDEIIGEAQEFINSGNSNIITIGGLNLRRASTTLYNILLSIGIFAALAIGMFLGIKFMTSSVEDKAKVKEALIPYIVGCVVIFGAFVIWKLTVNLLSGIDKVSTIPYHTEYTIAKQVNEK